jgi:hypothetical protein
MALSFGSDPELFLTDEQGAVIPAVGLVGGTKDKPLMVESFGMQEDNVMGEYTTPVANNSGEMVAWAMEGGRTLLRHVRARNDRHFGIYQSPVAYFDAEVLLAAGPQAVQFGCSPDFDAYAMGAQHGRVDPRVLRFRNGAYRFAGGHVHLGYKDVTKIPEHVVAMFCDLTIGASLVWGGERQGRRRELYGMPGRYRPTSYGIEYRTPSNLWIYDARAQNALRQGIDMLCSILTGPVDAAQRLYNEVPWGDLKTMISDENDMAIGDFGTWLAGSYRDIGCPYAAG